MCKLSIVIPTKDRYQTLFPVIDAILDNIEGDSYEVVISDNTVDNSSAVKCFSLNKYSSKIRYSHTIDALTQSGNSDRALSLATGDYIVFIGDDDLVSPYILRAIDLMIAKNIDCLIYTPANYYWEGVKFSNKTRMKEPESVLIPKKLDGELTKLDSQVVLQRVLNNGAVSIENLPQQYHAIVSKQTLEKIKAKFGAYVPGPCPDMTLAISLTYVLNTYYSIDYPFTVTGVSKHSAAGLGERNMHVGKLEDQKFLPKNIVEQWNPMFPKIWTACTIWGQSVFHVMSLAGDKCDIYYPEFYARMSVREPFAKEYVKDYIKTFSNVNQSNKLALNKSILKQKVKIILISIINIILGGTHALKYNLITNIKTPDDCMKSLRQQGYFEVNK